MSETSSAIAMEYYCYYYCCYYFQAGESRRSRQRSGMDDPAVSLIVSRGLLRDDCVFVTGKRLGARVHRAVSGHWCWPSALWRKEVV